MLTEAVKAVILDAMKVVTSADKAYAYLREQGYEWTRAFVREAWKETGQADYWSTVLQTYGTDRTPPKAWTIERTVKEGEGYQHILKVTTQDWESGKIEDRFFSAVLDQLTPFADVEEQLSADIELYAETFGFSIVDIAPGGIVRYVSGA